MPRPIPAVAALVCLLAPAAARAQQATLTDDASTWAGKPPAPKSRGTSLQVAGAADRTYLKFDLAPHVPDGIAGAHIGRATIELFVTSVSQPGQIAVHRVTGGWDEETITHADAPPLGAVDASFSVDAGAAGRWVSVDVTQLVRDWIDGADANEGVALVGLGGTAADFDSKENAATAHEPRLTLVVTHTATAGHAQTAGDADTLGGAAPGDYVRTDDPRLAGGGGPPSAGSAHYIQNNEGAPQAASFNIGGTGTAGSLSAGVVNAQSAFALGGIGVLRAAGIGHPFGESLYIGRNAGANAAPDVGLNTFVGSNAGAFTTTGAQNAFFGSNAGNLNATGRQNAYFGDGAGLFSNASQNSFFGFLAGFRNTTGGLNAFFGSNAGESTTTGCCNSFFGNFAGVANTTGWANVFVGGSAGAANTTGMRNAFLGDLAGYDLATNTGNSTGSFNTFIGGESGRGVVTGSHNTFLGHNTQGVGGLEYATAIGADAVVSTSNTIVLGRPADTVVVPGALSLNVIDAATHFNIDGERVLVVDPLLNVSVGPSAGMANGGRNNTNVGNLAGQNSTGIANVFLGNRTGRSTSGNSNTFVGSIAGEFHMAGSDNTFVGDGAGAEHTAGSENAYFGVDAGRGSATTDASRNAFFGTLAGRNIVNGVENAAFGYRAGYAQRSASGNAFFGAYAGENTTQPFNAFFGFEAGRANTTGSFNTFVGRSAGLLNTEGGGNTFVGDAAGWGSTTGWGNTFVGGGAGSFNTDGGESTIVGNLAGYTTRGHDNTLIGSRAGFNVNDWNTPVTGSGNTFVGVRTGTNVVGGARNTLLGADAHLASGELTHATAIGAGAVVGTSNTVVLGRDADTVRVPGSLAIAGAFSAAAFSGNGAGLTNLDAANVTTGVLAPARLGAVVRGVNGLTDQVTLAAGPNITITPAGSTLTIAASGGGGAANAILNQAALQPGATFNIGGTGAAAAFDAASQYRIGGAHVLSAANANVFAGPGAGQLTVPGAPHPISGTNNAFFGYNAGASNVEGSQNAFFGAEAGASLRDREANSFFGFQSGKNTLASANSFFGYQSGLENVMGVSNAFFGFQAGQFNRDGSSNTFVGFRAGFRNQASGNAFFGHDAGRENTAGFGNSYFGTGAGQNIVEGSDNSIFGASAGATFSINASQNAFFGAWAGLSNRGSHNVFVGFDAGRLNADGESNTFVGSGAGRTASSGVANTMIGFNALTVDGLSNATAIGAHAFVGQSDSLVLGAENVRVGIGYNAPREKLDVTGGNILLGSAGAGIILKSPDGNTCALLALDNAGALAVSPVACP